MNELAEAKKVTHLLRRFGLGASEAEIAFYSKNGLQGAIDQLLNYESLPVLGDPDPQAFANKQGTVNLRVMQNLYYLRLITTQRPLEEKLTLFWHNHFAVSAMKVENAYVMRRHIETLRSGATGKFLDLLTNVSQDPGMIYWLDTELNVKGQPNENFAREVMELFTLGIGHYSEKDIQEAARAFTGWTFASGRGAPGGSDGQQAPRRTDRFYFNQNRHDDGQKTVLGKTGNWKGEDVLKMLAENPQTARFIAHKMWTWFAGPEPSPALLERLASQFRQSGLDIKVLVRAIMESAEFYTPEVVGAMIKTPIDFAVGTIRQLGVGQRVLQRMDQALANPDQNQETGLNQSLIRALAPCSSAWQATKSMGMELMYPPDVSGWRTGDYWISTATMVTRAQWSESLWLGGRVGGAVNIGGAVGGGRGPAVGADAWPLLTGKTDPGSAVDTLLSILDAELPKSKRDALVAAATSQFPFGVNQQSANEFARLVTKAVFASPEFQFF